MAGVGGMSVFASCGKGLGSNSCWQQFLLAASPGGSKHAWTCVLACCCWCCSFCNVRYVIALLRDLLVGLDVAQRVLGFTHYDLK